MKSNDKPHVIDLGEVTGREDVEWWRTRLRPALDAIECGGLVAFPTETVYGLGADATRPEAIERIFEAKGRPPGHPLIVHVSSAEQARSLSSRWTERAQRLAEAFWPGPLTLVVQRGDAISDVVTGGLLTVGLRAPAHPVAAMLIQLAGVPIAAPSANPHQGVSPTRAAHVQAGLGSAVDVIVDGGATEVGLESTVLSLTDQPPRILRPGGVTKSMLETVVGEVAYGDGVTVEDNERRRPSPGMAAKHYAPTADVRVAPLEDLRSKAPRHARRGWMLIGEDGREERNRSEPADAEDPTCVLPPRPETYAAQLYDALHRLDGAGCEWIGIEAPPTGEAWRAIWDRLRRAAA
jgi:L-threonylcarbamoyladenylate synthase